MAKAYSTLWQATFLLPTKNILIERISDFWKRNHSGQNPVLFNQIIFFNSGFIINLSSWINIKRKKKNYKLCNTAFCSPKQEVFDSSHSPASSLDLWGSVGGKAWQEFWTNTLLYWTVWHFYDRMVCVSERHDVVGCRGRRHCGWRGGGANSLRQINKYSKTFLGWNSQ